jgi:hypothetical protein
MLRQERMLLVDSVHRVGMTAHFVVFDFLGTLHLQDPFLTSLEPLAIQSFEMQVEGA